MYKLWESSFIEILNKQNIRNLLKIKVIFKKKQKKWCEMELKKCNLFNPFNRKACYFSEAKKLSTATIKLEKFINKSYCGNNWVIFVTGY